MHCLIVDDEKSGQQVIQGFLRKFYPTFTVVGKTDSVASAIRLIKALEIDLVFMDIKLPDGTGLDILKATQDASYHVIFVTAHETYAIRTINEYRNKTFHDVLKPADVQELIKAVNKIQELQHVPAPSSDQVVSFKSARGVRVISKTDIVRCEGEGSYTRIILVNGDKHLISKSLGQCALILCPPNFVRIHQSYIVNIEQVVSYTRGRGGSVRMKDGTTLPVSNSRKAVLFRYLNII